MPNSTPSIGTTLACATASPATYDASGYGALTFTDIGKVASISARGDTHAEITPPADLATGRVTPRKGAVSGGNITVTVHTEDYADGGQDLIRTAAAAMSDAAALSFEETDRAGNIRYWEAEVHSYRFIEASENSYNGIEFGMLVHTAIVVSEA